MEENDVVRRACLLLFWNSPFKSRVIVNQSLKNKLQSPFMKKVDFWSVGRFWDKKQDLFFRFSNFSLFIKKKCKNSQNRSQMRATLSIANVTTSIAKSIEWLSRGAHHAKSNGVLNFDIFQNFEKSTLTPLNFKIWPFFLHNARLHVVCNLWRFNISPSRSPDRRARLSSTEGPSSNCWKLVRLLLSLYLSNTQIGCRSKWSETRRQMSFWMLQTRSGKF